MRKATLGLAILFVAGCVKYEPPKAPAPREATTVSAPFDATWEAAVDHFAERNIPIATIEKVSGIIATARLGVTAGDAPAWADCGAERMGTTAIPYTATEAVYNVLVRGDGAASTVRVTASWFAATAPMPCASRGSWEADAEAAIKARAERGR